MGLENEGGGDRIYLNIYQGKMARKVKADTPDAETRINKNNDTVHELLYDTLMGRIENIVVWDGEFGKQWNITIADADNEYQLSLPYSSSYANGLLTRLPNVRLGDLVKIKTYYIESDKDGKMRGYLVLHQKNEQGVWQKVNPYFTKEEPNGLPDMVQITVKGQKVWDDTDRLGFFEKLVADEIVPTIKKENPLSEAAAEEVAAEFENSPNAKEEEASDLPF